LRMELAAPAADWSGELRLWFPVDADRAALERAARAGGEVVEVRFEGGGGGAPERGGARNGGRTADGASAAEGGPGAARSGLVASRPVRVARGAREDPSGGVGAVAGPTAPPRPVAGTVEGGPGPAVPGGRFAA